jgi:ankyrin repeat protein
MLLDHGADVNARNEGRGGKTPLHWAAYCCGAEVVKLFVANGADVNAADDGGNRPLHEACTVVFRLSDANPVLRRVAEVTEPRQMAVAVTLLASGANVNAKNARNETPLDWAVERDHPGIAEVLRRNGASRGKS